jgi:cytochrome c oxidase subunit 3
MVSLNVFLVVSGLVCFMHRVQYGALLLLIGLISLLISMYVWWRDVIRESTYKGEHTLIVQRGLKYGFILFLMSEIMFFFGFFWAFFASSLSPSIFIGGVWPPVNINPLNPWGVPLLNTAILLLSGLSITWVHFSILAKNYNDAIFGFVVTLFLAVLFTSLQISEYLVAPFNISDSVYGSAFYSLTGLHGFHVIIGTILITVCFIRFLLGHFTAKHHIGFELASWYWHFVDVVRLFLFVFVYIWGSW